MNFEISAFHPCHFKLMVGRTPPLIGETTELARVGNIPGMAFTAFVDGKVIGSAGIIPFWLGVGEAWAVIPSLRHSILVRICRETREWLPKIMDANGLHRVQATVPSDLPQAAKFAAFVGFRMEGFMEGFAPNKSDYIRYSIVRK